MPEHPDGREVCAAMWPINPSAKLLSMDGLTPAEGRASLHRCTEAWSHSGDHACACGATMAEIEPERVGVFCTPVADWAGDHRAAGSEQRACAKCGAMVWVAPSSLALDGAEFFCITHAPGMGVTVITPAPSARQELADVGMTAEEIVAAQELTALMIFSKPDGES